MEELDAPLPEKVDDSYIQRYLERSAALRKQAAEVVRRIRAGYNWERDEAGISGSSEKYTKHLLFKNRIHALSEECSLSLYRSWYLYAAAFGALGTYFAGRGESATKITAGILCALFGAGVGVVAAASSRKAKQKIASLKEERADLEEKLRSEK